MLQKIYFIWGCFQLIFYILSNRSFSFYPSILHDFLNLHSLLVISIQHSSQQSLEVFRVLFVYKNAEYWHYYSWLRYLWSSSKVFMLNGCFLSSNSRRDIPKAHISKAFPKIIFYFSMPIISSGAAYPFVPINLLVTLSLSDLSYYFNVFVLVKCWSQ